jgi:glycosyltransferase involved in cell wall biosynthesis
MQKTLSSVSLICTIFNETKTIRDFLQSIFDMTSLPEEIIIVDGGSIDGTVEKIKQFKEIFDSKNRIHLIVDSTCNTKFTPGPVARGRNIAIRVAKGSIIACTDAGCKMDKQWLGKIIQPFLSDAKIDVVGGWYLASTHSFIQECIAMVFLAPSETVNPQKFLPSSRSFAFRKSVWEMIGGYPEESLTGEDTLFVQRIRSSGYTITFVPDALVYWELNSTVKSFVKVLYRYGFGDGYLAINWSSIPKILFKLLIPILFIVAGFHWNIAFLVGSILFWWFYPFRRQIHKALEMKIIARIPMLAFLEIANDLAYLVGYIKGTCSTKHPHMRRIK